MQTFFGKWFDSLSGENIYRFYSAVFALIALCCTGFAAVTIYWIFTRISDKPQAMAQYIATALFALWAVLSAASALHKRDQIEKSEEIHLSHLPYAVLFFRMAGEILALYGILKSLLHFSMSALPLAAGGWLGQGNQLNGILYLMGALCALVLFHTLADAIDFWIYSADRKQDSAASQPEPIPETLPEKPARKESREIISPELQMLLDLKNSGAVNDAEFKLLLKELRSK